MTLEPFSDLLFGVRLGLCFCGERDSDFKPAVLRTGSAQVYGMVTIVADPLDYQREHMGGPRPILPLLAAWWDRARARESEGENPGRPGTRMLESAAWRDRPN
jgi:hypothetical protein